MAFHRTVLSAVGLTAAAVLFAGCSSTSTTAESSSSSTSPAATTTTTTTTSAAAAPAGTLVGPGCASYAEQVPTGPGSVSGMSKDPVTVAASNNPLLKTLTSALSGKLNPNVNLVQTLDSGQFTVFAPTDDAFAKLDPATVEKLKTDSNLLTSILTYHVVPAQASPAQVVGQHKTVQGAEVTVTGSGDALKVNDANVVCGGVQTANATVYLIDTVLMPPAQ
ncbi:fasciclin domain-containing protein [Mycolicibacterium sp. ELW1]|uniref:fasciclin domain-containing protein n=1 Tax=Mycobacteriaceae TaxID=1762 RepID=UPI0011EEF870|nr:fasciclin domain-containing protein [Mycobacterium sp. ELW1]QEN15068.1 fasciclin domain-containing protein [Mycobacterium sp. ELW1]